MLRLASQYAAIWAEISNGAAGVSLVNRVGLRMYVDVGGDNPAPTSFLDSLTAVRGSDGRPGVSAQVHNDGGRALDISGTVSLSDGPGSLSAGPFPAQVGSTLAPGQSLSVMIPLDRQLPDGPWQVSLTLRSGLTEKTAQGRIQFPSGPGDVLPDPGLNRRVRTRAHVGTNDGRPGRRPCTRAHRRTET